MTGAASISQLNAWRIFVVLLVLVLAVFHIAVWQLLSFWLESPEYGHGLLLTGIGGWLIWKDRQNLVETWPQGGWWGIVCLLFALFLLLASVLADIDKAGYYALVWAVVGVVLFVGGRRLLWRWFFPLSLLVVSLPLPYLVNKLLTQELQLVSSKIGVMFIRMMDLPVSREGNIIDMGSFILLVEEACSGLRYLLPLLGIGWIAAWYFRANLLVKALVLVSTIPITVLMNSFRIAATGWLIKHYGADAAQGFLHDFEGWAVFMTACLVFLVFLELLTLIIHRHWGVLQYIDLDRSSGPLPLATAALPGSRVYLLAGLLVVGGLVVNGLALSRHEVIPARTDFSSFPLKVGQRHLFPDVISNEVLAVLQADDYLLADFIDGKSSLNLYIAYYGAQKDGSIIHSPKDCLPGGGWEILSNQVISLEPLGYTGQANRALIGKESQRLLVYYWVNQQGVNYASEIEARASLLMRSVLKGRTDGALIRVIVPVSGDEAAAEQQIKGFVAELAPVLPDFLPR